MNHLDTAGLKNKYYLIVLRMYEENKYMFLTLYYSTNKPRFQPGVVPRARSVRFGVSYVWRHIYCGDPLQWLIAPRLSRLGNEIIM